MHFKRTSGTLSLQFPVALGRTAGDSNIVQIDPQYKTKMVPILKKKYWAKIWLKHNNHRDLNGAIFHKKPSMFENKISPDFGVSSSAVLRVCSGQIVSHWLRQEALVPWSPGPLVPWSPGLLVPWSPGPLVPWSPGPLVGPRQSTFSPGSPSVSSLCTHTVQ